MTSARKQSNDLLKGFWQIYAKRKVGENLYSIKRSLGFASLEGCVMWIRKNGPFRNTKNHELMSTFLAGSINFLLGWRFYSMKIKIKPLWKFNRLGSNKKGQFLKTQEFNNLTIIFSASYLFNFHKISIESRKKK